MWDEWKEFLFLVVAVVIITLAGFATGAYLAHCRGSEVLRVPVTVEVAKPAASAESVVVVVGIPCCRPCKTLWGALKAIGPKANRLGWWGSYCDACDPESVDFLDAYEIRPPYPHVLVLRDRKIIGHTIGGMSERELRGWLKDHRLNLTPGPPGGKPAQTTAEPAASGVGKKGSG